ncbi:MAG: hypothetical protein H6R16_1214 [Proteobacteria bacterium]|nr:hypothetical protein [Pseudomonadota bacterium]
MKIDLVSSELYLTNSDPIRLSRARGVRIRCVGGTIWITTPDRLADIFLELGESHLIDSQGLVLVESVSDGRVCLERERQSNGLTDWLEWLRCTCIKRRNMPFTACALRAER